MGVSSDTTFSSSDSVPAAPSGGGLSDGDYGDVVVGGGGTTMMFDSAVVTAAAKTVLDDATVAAMVDTLGGASSTGTGGLVRATSPTLVTPAIGTPSSGNLSNCTNLPAHQSQHVSGGSDSIKLDDLAAPDDNTDLNASTTKHGLLKKLSNVATEFLNGLGNWVALPSGKVWIGKSGAHELDNWTDASPGIPSLAANGTPILQMSNTVDTSFRAHYVAPPHLSGSGTIKIQIDFGCTNTSASKGVRFDVYTDWKAANANQTVDAFGSANSATVTVSTTSGGRTIATITLSNHGGTPAALTPLHIKVTRDQDHAGDDVNLVIDIFDVLVWEEN